MEQQYKIENNGSFVLKHIFECGQCFRWNEELDGSYTGVFKNNVLNAKEQNHQIIFDGICDGDIKEIVTQYFDLDRDYDDIKNKLSKIDEPLKNSIDYGNGIRLLNQDLWETTISFIISANNNIPRIKGIIERMARRYGNKIEWKENEYYTFPTPEQLSKASVEDLRALVLGFRDNEVTMYIYRETILLSQIGIAVGWLFGIWLHNYILTVVPPDQVMFDPSLWIGAYIIPFIVVNIVTFVLKFYINKELIKVDMIEVLKSVD